MRRKLRDRQKKILSIIVDSYVETAEPVGSRTISRKYHLDVSPATIRNEMSDLEEAGLVTHPHTSAGRIPTDRGYRYFIDYLLKKETVSMELAEAIANDFRQEIEGVEDLIEKASRILSAFTEQAGVVSYPEVENLSFAGLKLHPLDGTHVVAIWMTASGWIHDQVIDMKEEVSEETVKRIMNFFNTELSGVPFRKMSEEITRRLGERRDSLHALYQQSFRILNEALRKIHTARVCLEGSFHILEKPEFQDSDKSLLLFRALENRDRLLDLLREDPMPRGIRVQIGRENKWQEIWNCSLITSHYAWKGNDVGVLGILGPSRMRYAQAMALVQCVAQELSRALERWR